MSVFATHIKTRHVRNLAILVAVSAVATGGVLFGLVASVPLTAALRDAVSLVSPPPASVSTETVFPQPRSIDWEGVVFGILAGGRGLAVRRADTGEMFQAYGVDGQTASVSYVPVRIRGRWTGISCAYEQTVFGGQCTPTVDIDVLEILPITLE